MPPVSGISPSLQNASMKLADFAAMTMSHANAMLAPAPAATPLTAQTTGIGSARKPEHERLVVALDRRAEIDRRIAGRDGAVDEVLAGAEAAPGAGQQQHARGRVGAARAPSASRTSACIASLKLLSRSGRLSVSRAMPPSIENRMCS